MATEIVDLGSSRLDPDTNEIKVQAKSEQMGDDPDDAPGYDDIPLVTSIGLSYRHYPRTAEGAAQGIVDTGLAGANGWCTNTRDRRAASCKVYEQLAEGETAVHSTGPGFDSRTFHKDQLWAAMVGDDCAIVIDRKEERITITGFGVAFEISRGNGVVLSDDEGASIQIKNGTVCITGKVVLGGRTPGGLVQFSSTPVPVVGVSGECKSAPGVFIGL